MDKELAPLSLRDSFQYFAQLDSLSTSVDDFLKSNARKQWDKVVASNTLPSHPEFVQSLAERKKYWELAIIFPNTLWSSIFLSAYSLIEHTLVSFSKEINHDDSPEIRMGGIFLAKKEITKHGGIQFPTDDPNWRFIELCNPIRNCIAHSSGDIDKSKNVIRIRKIIAIEPTLTEADGYLFLQKDFVDKFLLSASDFIKKLLALNYSVKR